MTSGWLRRKLPALTPPPTASSTEPSPTSEADRLRKLERIRIQDEASVKIRRELGHIVPEKGRWRYLLEPTESSLAEHG